MAPKKSNLTPCLVSVLNIGGLVLILLLAGLPVALNAHWANGTVISGRLVDLYADLKGVTLKLNGDIFLSWHDICQPGFASLVGMGNQQSSVDQICRNIHIARPAIYATIGLWLVALAVRVLTALLSCCVCKRGSIGANKLIALSTALTIPLLGAAAIGIIICVVTSSIAINTTIYAADLAPGFRNNVIMMYDAAWLTTMVAATPAVYLAGMELVILLVALRSNKQARQDGDATLLDVSPAYSVNDTKAPPPYSGFSAPDERALLLAGDGDSEA